MTYSTTLYPLDSHPIELKVHSPVFKDIEGLLYCDAGIGSQLQVRKFLETWKLNPREDRV